jgi:two-component system CheB/CheR fusion protein
MSNDPQRPTNEELYRRLREQDQYHATMLLDPEGRVLDWTGASEAIFGWSAEEVRGESFARLFTPEDQELNVPAHELRIAAENSRARDDRWMARKNGGRFWATGAMVTILDDQGQAIAFGKILRDRTDLKTEVERLRNQIEAMTGEKERKDAFIGAFAHEIRNNLMPLKMASAMIRSRGVPEELADYLEQSEQQVEITQRLIGDLLDAVRLGRAGFEPRKERVDLGDLLERIVEDHRPRAERRRQTLKLLIPAASIALDVDPARLRQVFANLLDNALKYTPENGRVWVKVILEHQRVAVSIEDTGAGISPAMTERVFELFTQAEAGDESAEGGWGIGLWLVKQLVELHGGTIAARSEGRDKGSEFTVRLPIVEAWPR